jgi:charged multivesicular body protein 6
MYAPVWYRHHARKGGSRASRRAPSLHTPRGASRARASPRILASVPSLRPGSLPVGSASIMGASSSASRSRRAKKPDGRVTEVDRQVLGLKTQRRKLSAYAARVATQIARETANAKALAKSGERARCLHALRRRKLHERNANRIDEWAMSVETLLSSIEQAQATAVVLKRLKEGNEALREAQAGYGVEDVHETLREMEAGAEREAEINAMLADQLDQNAEDAALAELAELERAANDTNVSETTEDAATTKGNEIEKTTTKRSDSASIEEVKAALPSAPRAMEKKKEEAKESGEPSAARVRVAAS